MADVITRLKVISEDHDAKLKRATSVLRDVAQSEHMASQKAVELAGRLGNMQTTAKNAAGQAAELKNAFKELSVTYSNLTDKEKSSPFGKELKGSLDQLKSRYKELDGQLKSADQAIGSNSNALSQLSEKFGMNIKQAVGWGAAIGAGKVALDTMKDAFFQSESNIDEWGRTIKGAEGAYDVFLQSINNGSWSSFFSNLETAVQGARDLYDALDRLGSIKNNNQAAIAIVQQQIAQLRLLKQQGQNVDDQLKAATQRLANLQKQAVDAGKTAGTMQMRNTIRNSVNTTLGRANGINDKTLDIAINRVLTGGQASMDAYKRNYEALKKRGTTARREESYTSATGQTYTRTVGGEFNINLLTKEQQKQYAIAKAITERETELQKGIATYAQAVNEGTASAREEFKGNRYALQGSTGGRGGTTTTLKPEYVPLEGSIDYYQKLAQEAQKTINAAATNAARDSALAIYNEYSRKIKELKEDADARASISNGTAGIAINTASTSSTDALKKAPELKIKGLDKLKTIGQQTAEAWMNVGNAIGAVGNALNSIENPAAKVMGTVALAIANIAGTFAKSLAGTMTTWDWIAGAAAGTATMISTIAAIKSATAGSFAQGGVIGGNSYSGDKLYARVNSGETVLNQRQARTALDMMDSGGGVRLDSSNLRLSAVVDGERLRFVLNANGKRTGRGELAYSR